MEHSTIGYAAALVTLSALVVGLFLKPKQRLPPGPRGLPIIGNVLDLPQAFEWIHWAKHHKLYGTVAVVPLFILLTSMDLLGPISSVQALGKTIVILNSLDVCKDLLQKRSLKYSDRPPLVLAGEL